MRKFVTIELFILILYICHYTPVGLLLCCDNIKDWSISSIFVYNLDSPTISLIKTSILLSTIINFYDTFHYVAFKTFEFLPDSIAFFYFSHSREIETRKQRNKMTKNCRSYIQLLASYIMNE